MPSWWPNGGSQNTIKDLSRYPLGNTPDFWRIIMSIAEFQSQPKENILYRTNPNRKWYVFVWKICNGVVGIPVLTFTIFGLLANPAEGALISFLPVWAAHLLTNFLYLELVQLASLTWGGRRCCLYIHRRVHPDRPAHLATRLAIFLESK